jgi:acetoin utilization protein AcuB
MRARDVMTDAVRTISPAATAEDAWQLMQQAGIRHLVVTSGSRLVGLVSDRDLGSLRGGPLRKGKTVADVMTSDIVTVLPETPVRKAANVMRGRSIGCLVVAVGDRVMGVVTVADLLELLGRGASRPVLETARPTLNHRVPHRKQHGSGGSW